MMKPLYDLLDLYVTFKQLFSSYYYLFYPPSISAFSFPLPLTQQCMLAYLDGTSQDVSIMREASGKWRSVVERVVRAVLGLLQGGVEFKASSCFHSLRVFSSLAGKLKYIVRNRGHHDGQRCIILKNNLESLSACPVSNSFLESLYRV